MKANLILIALFMCSLSTLKAQSNTVTPDPSGNGYGLYNHFSNITLEQIDLFLEKSGHELISKPRTTDAGKTWICTTEGTDGNVYYTEIYTDGTNIVGFEDTIID